MEFETENREKLPARIPDGIQNRPFRVNPFAEQMAQVHGPDSAALEGSRFIATNGTIGTAVATTTSITSFDATKPILLMQNQNGAGGAKMVLDYIRLIWGQVPTSATVWHWAMILSTANRYSSAGTQVTPRNVNSAGPGSGATVYIGAPVTTAANANVDRTVHRSCGRSVIPVISDEIIFKFGAPNWDGAGSLGGTVALRLPTPCGPVVLNPGDNFLLHGWGASNGAAPSWEYEIGWTER